MSEEARAEENAGERKLRKTVEGVVISAKMDKTRRVDVVRQAKHPIYNKYLRRRTVCYTHDESNIAQEGDLVEIMECRPMSKTKRWRLVRVVRAAGAIGESGSESATGPEEVSE